MAFSDSIASLELDDATQERVRRLAATRERSLDSVLREAIDQYLTREEKRQQFWQDTVEAWDEYEQTGLHVTGPEMELWFSKIEAGESCSPPECHR